ncbi:MAG: hypothetical protein K0R08_1135 [Solimicrobium sp.]|jgi:uncharacterized membrane protein YuzA (DUF378 family)|nr:hypothetical protein [Solimicrobium sp.]
MQIRLNAFDYIALILLIVGGINWGLVGAFNFDIVAGIFGHMASVSRIIYSLVGFAALYSLYIIYKLSKP